MEVNDKKYVFSNNVDALALASKYGCPLYVYDTVIIKKQYDKISTSFDVAQLKINYACKALSNINILKYINSLGAGLDAVSIQEVLLGIKAGFDPQKIFFTPNGVSIAEIGEAIQLNVNINIDNLSILEQFASNFPQYKVGVRINPHILAGGNSKISTGHLDSKFGISFLQLPHLKRIIEATGLNLVGLHMHTGSDILDSDVFLQGAEILFNVADNFPNLEYLDFGSGFKIDYKNNGLATDVVDLGKKISLRFNAFCAQFGKPLDLIFEPGKYLVSESGTFLAEVNVVKQTTSTVFVGLDSGLNHLIRPMLYDAYHRIENISRIGGRKRIYTVVGYICETDTFGVNRKITEVHEGDILAIHNAGAYCYMMSSNYNSRYRPAEVLIHDGQDYLIRERETMEDLLRNQKKLDIF
ncbi:MAG: diaminopimelate decarboxylase [Saprospiraceae bacterium]